MTRYSTIILLFWMTSVTTQAQDFRRFKVALGIPFAPVTSDQFDYYGGFYLEPAVRLKDDLSLGIYLAIMESDDDSNDNPDINSSETAAFFSTAFVLDKYTSLGRPRTFYGLMLGTVFHSFETIQRPFLTNNGVLGGEILYEDRTGVLIAPRIGATFGPLQMTMMYQFMTNELPGLLTMQAGVEISGGRKKKK